MSENNPIQVIAYSHHFITPSTVLEPVLLEQDLCGHRQVGVRQNRHTNSGSVNPHAHRVVLLVSADSDTRAVIISQAVKRVSRFQGVAPERSTKVRAVRWEQQGSVFGDNALCLAVDANLTVIDLNIRQAKSLKLVNDELARNDSRSGLQASQATQLSGLAQRRQRLSGQQQSLRSLAVSVGVRLDPCQQVINRLTVVSLRPGISGSD